ncbi:MAG: HisA/HisF-related TIM barrel protein [Candidatus Helarchaeota archaeon]
MRIIPVIDILNSKVVQGVRGERDKYFPIKSVFCNSAEILDVVDNLINLFKFSEIYIADLDSIVNDKEDFDYISNILNNYNIDIMIDAGISQINRARKLIDIGIKNLIIGTETLTSLTFITELKEEFNSKDINIIISIDLYKDKNITKCDTLKNLTPISIVKKFQEFEINEFIILDLSRVGSQIGGVSKVVYDVITNTDVKIITGGGINSINDIVQISQIKIDGVLIATALHNGSIVPNEIINFMKNFY